MKFLALTCLYTMFLSSSFAQFETEVKPRPTLDSTIKIPQFSFKGQTLEEFITYNIKYPKVLMDKGYQAKIEIQFTVNQDSSVSNVFANEYVPDSLIAFEQEAIRVIMLTSKKWKPASKKGKAIKMVLRIPIRFELSE